MRTWLREIRLEKGLTLYELGELVGVSWQSISYYENGSRRPSPEIAIKIGKILGFPWTRFYEDDNRKEAQKRDAG